MEKIEPQKPTSIAVLGEPYLLYALAGLLCDKAREITAMKPRGVIRLIQSSNSYSIKVFKPNEDDDDIVHDVEVTSKLNLSGNIQINMVPLGDEDLENEAIKIADCIVFVDAFGRGIHMKKRRDRMSAIYEEHGIVPWVVADTSEEPPTKLQIQHHEALYRQLFIKAPSALKFVRLVHFARLHESTLLLDFQNSVAESMKNPDRRIIFLNQKQEGKQDEELKKKNEVNSYIDKLIDFNIKFAKGRIDLLNKVIMYGRQRRRKLEEAIVANIHELQEKFEPRASSALEVKDELERLVEERIQDCILLWADSEVIFTAEGLLNFHNNLIDQMEAVEEVIGLTTLSTLDIELPELKHAEVTVEHVHAPSLKDSLSSRINQQRSQLAWSGFKALFPSGSFKTMVKEFFSKWATDAKQDYVAGLFSNLFDQLPEIIKKVLEEIEGFLDVMSQYYHKIRIIIDDYETRLNQSKNSENCQVPVKVVSSLKKFRILTLDGGGMRGLLLIDLLHYLSVQRHEKIINTFDLIGGTSTGGIIALALGFLDLPLKVFQQMAQGSIQSIEEFYWQLGKEIFTKDPSKDIKIPLFNATKLEKELQCAFGRKRLTELSQQMPKIFTVATRSKEGEKTQPHLFRTYNKPEGSKYVGSSSFYVWEAARATSAAPIYFHEFVRDGYTYIDGGVGNNNPTLIALDEAKSILGDEYHEYEIEVISFGTGDQAVPTPKLPSLLGIQREELKLISSIHGIDAEKLMQLALFMLELATSSETTNNHLQATLKNYVRVNPPLKSHIDLSETDPIVLTQMLFEAACCRMPKFK